MDRRILIAAAASVVGHFALARALDELPPREASAPPRKISVRVVQPPPKAEPPPPEPPKPPDPPPPKAEPLAKPVHEAPRPRKPAVTETAKPPPVETAAPSTTPDPGSTAKPKFGVSMTSTSQGGQVQVPVGNTTSPDAPRGGPAPAAPLPAPAAAHEVTKMPLPQGRCAGKYTDAARAAGIEGVVVLDVIVDEQGRTRDIQVVEALSHGLTEAAIAALRACRFTPGEKNGAPVPVRVRGFKIRFLVDQGS